MYYLNATEAFEHLYNKIDSEGKEVNGTKTLYNKSFTLVKPEEMVITTPARGFKQDYASYEYDWYKSGNRNATDISDKAKIWKNMVVPNTNGEVNSNYGYFWNYNDQLNRTINLIKENPTTRRAIIVHYDLNELDRYQYDTPCNVVLNFYVRDNFLDLTIFARSIDLYFGFCNDQYTFAKLMQEVSEKTDYKVGMMHWFITNLHIYERHYNKSI